MASVGQLWDRTTGYLGEHLSKVVPVAALGFFVPMALMAVIGLGWSTAAPGAKQLILLGYIALYLFLLLPYLAITARALGSDGGAWRAAGRRFLPAVGVYLVLFVAAAALIFPVLILMAMAGITPQAMETGTPVAMSRGMAWTALLYLVAVCIFLLVASARLVPLGGVLVAEKRGLGSIGRAWRLTRGMTWRLIGVLILYVVVSQIAGLAAQTVIGSVLRLAIGGTSPFNAATILTGAVVAGVQTIFVLLYTVFAAKLYEVQAAAVDLPAAGVDARAA